MTKTIKAFPGGPGYPLIRLQALATWPVSAAIPNAAGAQAFDQDDFLFY